MIDLHVLHVKLADLHTNMLKHTPHAVTLSRQFQQEQTFAACSRLGSQIN
jgi:hypothetical protein